MPKEEPSPLVMTIGRAAREAPLKVSVRRQKKGTSSLRQSEWTPAWLSALTWLSYSRVTARDARRNSVPWVRPSTVFRLSL